MVMAAALGAAACGGAGAPLTQLESVKAGALQVVLLADHEALRHGKDTFVLEFRSESGALVDVGAVKAGASMPMPGMPMFGTIDVKRTDVPGRYDGRGGVLDGRPLAHRGRVGRTAGPRTGQLLRKRAVIAPRLRHPDIDLTASQRIGCQ